MLVKGLKSDSKEVEGGRCVKGSDGKLGFSDIKRFQVWQDYMERINKWNHNVEGNVIEGSVACISREVVLQALNGMKTVKAPGPSEVSLELIAASWGVGIHVMAEICRKVLDRFGMPAEWALSIVVPIFKGKGDIHSCSCY